MSDEKKPKIVDKSKNYVVRPEKNIWRAPLAHRIGIRKSQIDNLDGDEIYNVKIYLYTPFLSTNTGMGLIESSGLVSEGQFVKAIISAQTNVHYYFQDTTINYVVGLILKNVGTIDIKLTASQFQAHNFTQEPNIAKWVANKIFIDYMTPGRELYDYLLNGVIFASFVDLNSLPNMAGKDLLEKYNVYKLNGDFRAHFDPNQNIGYVEGKMEKLLPFSGNPVMRWECYQDTEFKLENIAKIKLELFGPFIWMYYKIFNEKGIPRMLNYEIENGELFETTFEVVQSGTDLYFSSIQSTTLSLLFNRYNNLVTPTGFLIQEEATNDGIIKTNVPGIEFDGFNCMNNFRDGQPGGIIITTETRGSLDSLIKVEDLPYQYDGQVNYKLIRYNGGYGDGVDGLGNIFNLVRDLLFISDEENFIDNPFGYVLDTGIKTSADQASTPARQETTQPSQIGQTLLGGNTMALAYNAVSKSFNSFGFREGDSLLDGLGLGGSHPGRGSRRSSARKARRQFGWKMMTNIGKLALNFFNKEFNDFINASNYNVPGASNVFVLPRVFGDVRPQWQAIPNSLYKIDAWSVYTSPVMSGGFVDYYVGAISKPTRNDLQFAIIQQIDKFYFLSFQNKIDKVYLLNNFENAHSFIEQHTFLYSISDQALDGMMVLTPFTIEKLANMSKQSQFMTENSEKLSTVKKIMFPTNNLYKAPYLLTNDFYQLRIAGDIFERKFIYEDGILGNKVTLWLMPVDFSNINKMLPIKKMNSEMVGIFGGYEHHFTYYDLDGNPIKLGVTQEGEPIYKRISAAPNRGGNRLLVSKTMIYASNVLGEDPKQNKISISSLVYNYKDYFSAIFDVWFMHAYNIIIDKVKTVFHSPSNTSSSDCFPNQNGYWTCNVDTLKPNSEYTILFVVEFTEIPPQPVIEEKK